VLRAPSTSIQRVADAPPRFVSPTGMLHDLQRIGNSSHGTWQTLGLYFASFGIACWIIEILERE
jgi:hypothetical protein